MRNYSLDLGQQYSSRWKELLIHCNSTLIVNQVKLVYAAHNPTMGFYSAKAKTLLEGFKKYEAQQISHNGNGYADSLVNITSTVNYSLRWTIPFEYFAILSIHELELELVADTDTRENRKDEIVEYI